MNSLTFRYMNALDMIMQINLDVTGAQAKLHLEFTQL
jgi:hypothetical protein